MDNTVILIEPSIQPVGIEILKKNCNVVFAPNDKEETLIEYINNNKAQAIITRVERITRHIIESCKTLKVIGQHGAGFDNIDVKAASENGIMVLNVPDAGYVPVAEHAIMFMLALSRNLLLADKNVRNGNWLFREQRIPNELAEKTLLIVGIGRIGKEVARKALAFDMKVLSYDSYVSKEKMDELKVEKVETLEEGLKIADFVTVHAPATIETKHMLSTEQFKIMKRTSNIVNLSRGSLIDEEALYKALVEKEIAGAALDVFDPEPPVKDNPLFGLDNVIVTPHLGGDTIEGKRRYSTKMANTVVEALNGAIPYNCVNAKSIFNERY